MTTRCNTNCFSCCHTPDMRDYLDVEVLKKFIDKKACEKIGRISFCGRAGEALFHPRFLEFVKHLKNINYNLPIQFLTNGSGRDISWWEELADTLNYETDNAIFALDGLKGVHEIHRPGTNFDIIFRNLKAFIKAGGRADWQFILFKHNQHQVKEAEKIAYDIGCEYFRVIPSRIYNDVFEKPTIDLNLSPPKIFGYREKKDKDAHPIYCRHTHFDKGFYIASDGLVSPCLFLSTLNKEHIQNNDMPLSPKFKINFLKYKHDLDIYNGLSFEEIINLPYFKWVEDNHSKIGICGVLCGYNQV